MSILDLLGLPSRPATCSNGSESRTVEPMCPRCKSNQVSRSKRRKFLDMFMWFLGMKAYRCRDCQRTILCPLAGRPQIESRSVNGCAMFKTIINRLRSSRSSERKR